MSRFATLFLLLAAGLCGPLAAQRGLPLPTVAIEDASVTEGDAGTVSATFVVTLSRPAEGPVAVSWATVDASAKVDDGDYEAASGTLTIAAGRTSAAIDVTVAGDTLVEADEIFLVGLADPVGATLGDAEARGEIVDDDGPGIPGEPPQILVDRPFVVEGDAGTRSLTFTLRLTTPSRDLVTVEVATAASEATPDEDYAPLAATVRFPPGVAEQKVTVRVFGDGVDEEDEEVVLELADPTGATLADDLAVGRIEDDDARGDGALEPIGSPERTGRAGETIWLRVQVISTGGGPVPEALVSWALDGSGTLLDGGTTTTGPDGVAVQRVRLPEAPGMISVRAEDPDTLESALFVISVGEPPP